MGTTRLQVLAVLDGLQNLPEDAIKIAKQPKNVAFMRKIDYSPKDVIADLRRLTVAHYERGPTPSDWGGNATVWTFGLGIEDYPCVYIKLSYSRVKSTVTISCMSFHEPERPMKFPFATVGEQP